MSGFVGLSYTLEGCVKVERIKFNRIGLIDRIFYCITSLPLEGGRQVGLEVNIIEKLATHTGFTRVVEHTVPTTSPVVTSIRYKNLFIIGVRSTYTG